MKLSELQQILSKVQTFAGDVEVALRAAVTEAETVISDLSVHLDPTSGEAAGKLVVTHAAATDTPAEPAAADPAAVEGDPNAPLGTAPQS